ncbi:hypothetical protein COY33_01555 [candidate division WWE3 bacterium CG_4_10_14_0_2_um_filter_42_7]|uniref:Uncharacterized protein n=2 Tax=Katanobacteria TaxID=422282 RepID=A0A2H0XAB9_UNCKA|nr:MAG: hypothetical protein COT51_00575 [candidate division WWE3 bacterium CG08_land_8_20_14_0_20_41_15]PIZ43390.1 MAG: hypothetical protein COY33_01555 [candidate division WWE3 bacterium CG_4_10_14_0_2_um_filter_42_7]
MDFKEALIKNKKIAILVASGAPRDAYFAGAALSLVAKEMGKEVTLIAKDNVPEEAAELAFFQNEPGQKNLVISFDYTPETIEKVRYFSEDGAFNLILSPIPKDFNPENIRYSYTVPNFDLWVLFGISDLNAIPSALSEYKEEIIASQKVVFADKPAFGELQIDISNQGYSANLFTLLSRANLVPSAITAKALLLGLSGIA